MYALLFTLLGVVYVTGLFVPLMDNDSAHHANIALHMHLTGDYFSLVDYGQDYLDKPHLHFWLAAISYKIFGVTGFAYKFPSFLFTLLGIFSVYRLGRLLYDNATGQLAALISATAFAGVLANNDVRMEAILTASIALATWQLTGFIQTKKMICLAGAALGLALGFSTKGHIGVFVPAVGAFFYILYRRDWALFYSWKWLVMVALFALFIAPVVYAYYLQYNLHPEKVVRGKDHINGVKFILLNQSVERFGGTMGSDAKNDYLFFFHSFLWAFAPWSIISYIALVQRIRRWRHAGEEWLSAGVIITLALVVSLSGFKLPHYLNVVFPAASVLTASWLIRQQPDANGVWGLQVFISGLLIFLSLSLHVWAFPIQQTWVVMAAVLLLALPIYFWRSHFYSRLQRAVAISAAVLILSFFLLNTSFYPQLLSYQAGNELAFQSKGKINPARVYSWEDTYSSSFYFYTASPRRRFADSVLNSPEPAWLLFDQRQEEAVRQAGYQLGQRFTHRDYEITKLDIKFVNPEKRDSQCTELVLAEIRRMPDQRVE